MMKTICTRCADYMPLAKTGSKHGFPPGVRHGCLGVTDWSNPMGVDYITGGRKLADCAEVNNGHCPFFTPSHELVRGMVAIQEAREKRQTEAMREAQEERE